jgi:hypothetical protein
VQSLIGRIGGGMAQETELLSMTAELDKTAGELAGDRTAQRSQAPMTRRALLSSAAVTVPTILTLHSGAALAMSSNVVHAAVGAPKDPDGNYLCLDVSSTYGETRRRGVYDIGSPAHAEISVIPSDTEYYLEPKDGSQPVTGPEMCERGGTYYYKGTGSTGGSYDPRRRFRSWGVQSNGWGNRFDGWGGGSSGHLGGGTEGWQEARIPRGVMCSATALASWAARGAIDIREI